MAAVPGQDVDFSETSPRQFRQILARSRNVSNALTRVNEIRIKLLFYNGNSQKLTAVNFPRSMGVMGNLSIAHALSVQPERTLF
jgi:hypothetical protein